MGTPGADNDGCAPPAPVALTTQEVDDYLAADCAGCHVDGNVRAGLNFDNFSADLIGVPSSVAGLNYIEPGDRAGSYLFQKLAGTQGDVGGFGGRMPQGGPFLSDEELERFGLWIDGLPQ